MKGRFLKSMKTMGQRLIALSVAFSISTGIAGVLMNPSVLADSEDGQEYTSISLGDNDVVLDGMNKVEFSFVPEETGLYIFTTLGDMDTLAELRDSEGEAIAEDDDSGEALSFLIRSTLTAGETYILVCWLFDEPDDPADNDITLRVTMSDISVELMLGENEVLFDGKHKVEFLFVPEETGLYKFTTLGDMDTVAELRESIGNLIWDDDNSGDDNNFSIEAYLTEDKTYSLVCWLNDDADDNNVVLQVLKCEPAGNLVLGENEVLFDGEHKVEYLFVPEETGIYKFTTLGDMDTVAELRDSAGNVIENTIDNDDRGYSYNFSINSELTAGETYHLLCWIRREPDDQNDNNIILRVVKYDENEDSTRCGENVTWSFDEGPGNLTINGTGAMYQINDYFYDEFPWNSIKDEIVSVVIGKGITNVSSEAFCMCSNLKSVTISDSVASIESYAFDSCEGLETVVIPGSVKSIGHSAFGSCMNISSLTIGTGVTSIGENAFWGCSALTTVVIPDSVISIGPYAFRNCSGLTMVVIPDSVTSIGKSAFHNCSGLTTVVIPDSVTIIGESAFDECKSITSLTIGSGVASIGDYAFDGCTGLTSIVIPESVTSIGQDAFFGCENIAEVSCYANPATLTWEEGYCDDFSRDAENKTKCHVFPEYEQAYRDKFGNEVNVDFIGDLSPEIDLGLGGTLYGYSLSLEGDIGVKFYMDLTGVDLNTNPYVEFTVPSGSQTSTQKVALDQAEVINLGDKTYYAFECTVSAKDAFSIIKAQLFAGEQQSEIYSFSVKSYAEYIISHAALDAQYERSAPLAKALLSYCACAQKYFGTNPARLDESYIDDEVKNLDVSSMENIPTASVNVESLSGVTFEGATLSLRSETTLSLYFSSDEALSFTCDVEGVEIEPDIVGNYQVARIRGISAAELGDSFTVTVTKASGESEDVTYSVLNYCYNVVSAPEGTYEENLINVAKSLYLYYQAAAEYSHPTI